MFQDQEILKESQFYETTRLIDAETFNQLGNVFERAKVYTYYEPIIIRK